MEDKKWGFVDKTGKVVVPLIYDEVGHFREGLCWVRKDKKWGFVDKTGKVVVPLVYDYVRSFSEGLCGVNIGGQIGSYDVVEGGKWGFVNKKGVSLYPPPDFQLVIEMSDK